MFFKRKNQKPIATIKNLQRILADEIDSINICQRASETAKNEGASETAQALAEILKDEKKHRMEIERLLENLRTQ